jgi:hypothetical protein
VFDHAPGTGHDDKFEIVGSSAYRLRQSQCFLKSLDIARVLAAQRDMGAVLHLREAAKGRDVRVAQQAAAAPERLGQR